MPAKSVPCDVCMLRTTSDFNFLLNCCACKRGFHHRCCRPPIPDEVLTSLIKVTLKNKPGKGLKFWRCTACREGGVPASGQAAQVASTSSSVLSKKRKQDEIIVISDDENEPAKNIVVSSRPSSHRPALQPSTQQTQPEPALGAAMRDNERPTRFPRIDVPDVSNFQGPPLPSSSRFGLLSPPESVSGYSMRHTSTTPFLFDEDARGYAHNELSPQPDVPARAVLPTPSVSARTHSPPLREPSSPTAWASSTIRQDLLLLSREFKEIYHSDLAAPTPAASQRRPRKSVAKRLDKNDRTSGQRLYFRLGTPE